MPRVNSASRAIEPTAASERKTRVSTPPERLTYAGVTKSPKKGRGRGRAKSTKADETAAGGKTTKKGGKATVPGKRGRPAKGSSNASTVKSKGAKPVNPNMEYEVEKILDSKVKNNKIKYFVKWVGYPHSENTWEPEVNVRNAPDKIMAFDVEFPDKEYPTAVVKKPTKAAAAAAKVSAPVAKMV